MNEMDDCDPKHRRQVIHALAASLLAGGLFNRFAFAQESFSPLPVKLPEGQSIYRISGDVRVNGNAAGLRSRISAGDTVVTGSNAEVAFVVGDSAFMQRGNSSVELTAASQGSMLVRGLRLLSGALLSVFGGGRRLTLSTATSTIGIRGTGVYLEADPEQTYFCTCYGVADVTAVNDPQSTDTIASGHHDRPIYILREGEKAALIRAAPFVNHTDQELMLIETLVGRTVPFVFPKDSYRAPRRRY